VEQERGPRRYRGGGRDRAPQAPLTLG
jgi:hypothetical protein